MNIKQKHNWVVDAVLFLLFMLTFFMDLTGLALHQWIGIAAGAITLYHLAVHWKWVVSVSARFFDNTSMRCRLYYLLDASILLGFVAMIASGLIISTWLNLELAYYEIWRIVHIASSISTLVLVLVKLFAHWKWIVSVFKPKLSPQTVLYPENNLARTYAINPGRREFMKMMGVVGVTSAIALTKSFESLVRAQSTGIDMAVVDTAVQTQISEMVQSTRAAAAAGSNTEASVDTASSESAVTQQATATLVPTAVPTATQANLTSAYTDSSSTTCSIRCRKACTFPGRCRKYADSNGNGKCDLGECV